MRFHTRTASVLVLACGVAMAFGSGESESEGGTESATPQSFDAFTHAFIKSFAVILATEIGAPPASLVAGGNESGCAAAGPTRRTCPPRAQATRPSS